jgi:hypothetical protein
MTQLKSLSLLLLLSATTLFAQTAALPVGAAHFVINQGNHPVGRSDFSIQAIKQGSIATPAAYTVTSHGMLSLQNTNYSFSGSGTLDQDLALISENLNGIVNGSAVTFAVREMGPRFAIDISADGKASQNSVNRPAQTVFFPDFDLASYEILLTMASRHPGAPLSALIPKQTGILSAATLAPQADVQATLNGAPLTVHHSSLTIGSITSELYYSKMNRIFEVDIPSQAFAIVQDKFQLQPPPPPPADAAPNAQQPPATGNPQQQN